METSASSAKFASIGHEGPLNGTHRSAPQLKGTGRGGAPGLYRLPTEIWKTFQTTKMKNTSLSTSTSAPSLHQPPVPVLQQTSHQRSGLDNRFKSFTRAGAKNPPHLIQSQVSKAHRIAPKPPTLTRFDSAFFSDPKTKDSVRAFSNKKATKKQVITVHEMSKSTDSGLSTVPSPTVASLAKDILCKLLDLKTDTDELRGCYQHLFSKIRVESRPFFRANLHNTCTSFLSQEIEKVSAELNDAGFDQDEIKKAKQTLESNMAEVFRFNGIATNLGSSKPGHKKLGRNSLFYIYTEVSRGNGRPDVLPPGVRPPSAEQLPYTQYPKSTRLSCAVKPFLVKNTPLNGGIYFQVNGRHRSAPDLRRSSTQPHLVVVSGGVVGQLGHRTATGGELLNSLPPEAFELVVPNHPVEDKPSQVSMPFFSVSLGHQRTVCGGNISETSQFSNGRSTATQADIPFTSHAVE